MINNIKQNINNLIEPSNDKTLKENESIKYISLDKTNELLTLIISLENNSPENQAVLTRKIAKIVKLDNKVPGLKISYEDKIVNSNKDQLEIKFIGITSGKGGVGKSTVTANLALALTKIGKKVGIIDADIYGASIPKIFDIKHQSPRADENEKILPFSNHGVELISSEFFVDEGTPIVWRGPMLGRLLNHFFKDMKWNDDIEYILIDLPPGTGDVSMDIQRLIPTCKMLLVTTPHPNASHVAVKSGVAAKKMNHEILGVVENMSYYTNPSNGNNEYIFGQGGGDSVTKELSTKLLTTIPIGQPQSNHHSLYDLNEEIGVIYLGLANKIIKLI